jgi:hypothetical protein
MNTGFPGPTDYSPRRSASAGPRPGNRDPSAQLRGFPSGGLRASDAERDTALAELSEHFQAGRLTTEELDERTSRILAARTGDELEVQLSDLPNLAVPAPAPPQYRPPRPVARLAPRLIPAVVIVAVAALAVALGHHGAHAWNGIVVPLLIVIFIGRRLARR